MAEELKALRHISKKQAYLVGNVVVTSSLDFSGFTVSWRHVHS